MSRPNYSSAAIHEAWEKVGKQRWDGRTHDRGLGLLIVDALTAQVTLDTGQIEVARPDLRILARPEQDPRTLYWRRQWR